MSHIERLLPKRANAFKASELPREHDFNTDINAVIRVLARKDTVEPKPTQFNTDSADAMQEQERIASAFPSIVPSKTVIVDPNQHTPRMDRHEPKWPISFSDMLAPNEIQSSTDSGDPGQAQKCSDSGTTK